MIRFKNYLIAIIHLILQYQAELPTENYTKRMFSYI